VRAAGRWPLLTLTAGMAVVTGGIAVTMHELPASSSGARTVAAAETAPAPDPTAGAGPCYECGQYSGNIHTPTPAPTLPSLHPVCVFRINVIPGGAVLLATWGDRDCAAQLHRLQLAEDHFTKGTPVAVIVTASSTDPTTAGAPACSQRFGPFTERVYPDTGDTDAFMSQEVCTGLSGAGQKGV
jgi:hypothetical protein